MEIVIHKDKDKFVSVIYETYTSSTNKKKVFRIVSKTELKHALSLAWFIIKNYKWIGSSIQIEDVKPKKKYYNKKSNKK